MGVYGQWHEWEAWMDGRMHMSERTGGYLYRLGKFLACRLRSEGVRYFGDLDTSTGRRTDKCGRKEHRKETEGV